MFSPQKKVTSEVMGVLINLIIVISSQCIYIYIKTLNTINTYNFNLPLIPQ